VTWRGVPPSRYDDAHSTRLALRLVALGTAAFVVVAVDYAVSAHTARGQTVENALMGIRRHQLEGRPFSATEVLATVSVWSLVATIAAVMVVALARGRPRLALGAGAVIAGSIVTTEVLKKLILPRPALDPNAPPWLHNNIFPSGHTTIAVATAVAFVLVVPYRLRGPAALAGGFYAAALGASTLEAGWHRTSDAIGAVFLVLGIALWACGGLVWWRGAGHPPERDRMWAYVPLAVVAAVGGIVNIVGIPRTLRAIDAGPLDNAGVQEAYAVSLALVALAVAVAMGVLLVALRDVSLDTPADAPPGTA
jgi:membrane-associated phospholipid phosphatase